MADIFTSKGDRIQVSEQDFAHLSRFKWCLNGKGYASRNPGKIPTTHHLMHIEIMRPEKGQYIDHINHDKLDNRRENLRLVQKSANCRHLPRDRRMKPHFIKSRANSKPWIAEYKLRGLNRKLYGISLGKFSDYSAAQERIDRYHELTLSLQLEGRSQEDIFQIISEIRRKERIENGERSGRRRKNSTPQYEYAAR